MLDFIKKYAAVSLLVAILVIVVTSDALKSCRSTPARRGSIIVVHDTTVRIVPETHIEYVKKATVRWMHDTVYFRVDNVIRDTVRDSFVAWQDTTIGKIRIRDTFAWPSMQFRTCVDREADSIQVVNSVILVRDTVAASSSWWNDALRIAGSALVGFTIGVVAR